MPPDSPDVLRSLLVLYPLIMACLAALYLRRRRLSFSAYLAWGLLIVFLPLVGPFLVLLAGPGRTAR